MADADLAAEVNHSSGTYPVVAGWGVINTLGDRFTDLGLTNTAYIITDSNVMNLYGRNVFHMHIDGKIGVLQERNHTQCRMNRLLFSIVSGSAEHSVAPAGQVGGSPEALRAVQVVHGQGL